VHVAEIVERAIATVTATMATTEGLIALISVAVAAALIFAGSFVKTMIPLRWLGLGSNFGFIVYGALFPSLPVLALHSLLVPVNLYRLVEMIRLSRRVDAAAQVQDTSGLWLRPYMKRRKLKTGAVLFRKGDLADHLYMLVSGRIELVEIGNELPAGRIFGEIAFFAPDRRRTLTARCLEDSEVLAINESTVRQLYFQNPEFGFQVIGLVAGRLSADIRRLEAALDARREGDAAAASDTPISSA
jgi:phosphotransferase system  glucose/maltose/N-acetylglucosamine-specific IIC component